MTNINDTTPAWNPHAAKPAMLRLFRTLQHLGAAHFETCGGATLDVYFDPDENALIATDDAGREVWRVPDFFPD